MLTVISLSFFQYFPSVNYDELFFVFEAVQVASSILDDEEIKLLQRLMADILLNKSISRW